MATITTQLWFNGTCSEALELYATAFGAKVVGEIAKAPDGSVMHAMMRIGDSNIMMSDAWPGGWEHGPRDGATAGLFVYVDDCDAFVAQADYAGCTVLTPCADMFWGDRMGKVKDPFGHCWGVATHKWDYTPEEIAEGQQLWLASMKGGE